MIDAKKLKEEILEVLSSKYPNVAKSVKIGYRVRGSKVYLNLERSSLEFKWNEWNACTYLDRIIDELNKKNGNHYVLWVTSSSSRGSAVFRVYDLLDKDCPAWVRKYA